VEVDEAARRATVLAYATSCFEGAEIVLKGRSRVYLKESVTLSPVETCKFVTALDEEDRPHDLHVAVLDASGRVLIDYRPKAPEIEQVPEAAKPLPEPEEVKTNEELYLAGLHLEEYRHATFEPDRYYLEGLKRDPN